MADTKRDRHLISLNGEEYRKLSTLKSTFEQWTGDSMTWGQFLITVTTPAASSSGTLQQFSPTVKMEDAERQ